MNFIIIKMVKIFLNIFFRLELEIIIVLTLFIILVYMIFCQLFFSKNFTKNYLIHSHHIFNLTFSILSVFGVYQTTKILFNSNIGKIAFIICFLNPIYFGHFSINPKDTIIAFCYIWIFCISLKYSNYQKKK